MAEKTYKSVGVLRFLVDPTEDDNRWILPGDTFKADLHPDREKFLRVAGLIEEVKPAKWELLHGAETIVPVKFTKEREG